jgi:hypothetical protein
MYYAEWVMFFDDYAEELHPTFQTELSQQLFEKGSVGTRIKQFGKYDFQLIVGMKDMQMKVAEDKMYAKIEFITPTSFSFLVDIYWTADNVSDISTIHKYDVTGKKLSINWADSFPLNEILPHIRPYRIARRGKNGFDFDIEYYYYLLPDVTIELKFESLIDQKNINMVNTFLLNFIDNWNNNKKGKEIDYISNIEKTEEKYYAIVADLGVKNSISVITDLFKAFTLQFDNLKLDKVTIR